MPLNIYKLQPGEQVTYDIRPVDEQCRDQVDPLAVRVERPREGVSLELQVTLMDPAGVGLTSGRVPIERGYMAVVQELRKELLRSGLWPYELEFELVARNSRVAPPAMGFGTA